MFKFEFLCVDGVYDFLIGLVCYYVDNVYFIEFYVFKELLWVINYMDEDEFGVGLSTTVEVRDINIVM